MDSYLKRSPDTTVGNSSHSSDGEALEDASRLLRLIPFPAGAAESLSALAIPLLSLGGGPAKRNPVADLVPDVVRQPADAIVSAAAAILDEEMARGVLAARNVSPLARSGVPPPDQGNALLRQVHDLIDNAARMWPSLQGVAGPWQGAPKASASNADPLPELKPASALRPGQRATISMTLCNRESRAIDLTPAGTDLLGSGGKRIASHLLALSPKQVHLEPGEQRDMEIAFTVPAEVTPGCYSGLLVVSGVEYLRALIVVDVA